MFGLKHTYIYIYTCWFCAGVAFHRKKHNTDFSTLAFPYIALVLCVAFVCVLLILLWSVIVRGIVGDPVTGLGGPRAAPPLLVT